MIRFLADADLNEGIIGGCLRREPTMDFLSASEAKLQGLADPDVLRIAAEQDRILVTHDFKTMPRHFAHFLSDAGFEPRRVPGEAVIADRSGDRGACSDLDCHGCRGVEGPDPTNSSFVTGER